LRKWESTGELLPKRKTKGGTRYYDVAELSNLGDEDAPTVCYARVSSHDQKTDLQRQQEMLETYCAAKGWRTALLSEFLRAFDVGSVRSLLFYGVLYK
jgi:predicted site-specific integrase-resolvase